MFEYEKPVVEIIDIRPVENVMSLTGSDGGNEEWDEEWE